MTSHSEEMVYEMTEEELVGLSHSLQKVATTLRNEIENLQTFDNDVIEGFLGYLHDRELEIQLSLMLLQGAINEEEANIH